MVPETTARGFAETINQKILIGSIPVSQPSETFKYLHAPRYAATSRIFAFAGNSDEGAGTSGGTGKLHV